MTLLDGAVFFGSAKDESKLLFSTSRALDTIVENKIDILFIQHGSSNENFLILAALLSDIPCLMIQGKSPGSADTKFEKIRASASILALRKTRQNIELSLQLKVPSYENSYPIVSNSSLPPKIGFLKVIFSDR